MFSFGIIPDPRTALDQTPDAPTPGQQLRLAEALYYASSYWQTPRGGHARYFDQLSDDFQAGYYRLGRWLVSRRLRPGHRPPTPAQVEARALTFLSDTAALCACLLYERPTHDYSSASVARFLRSYYPQLPLSELTRLATHWLATRPVQAPLPY